MELLPFTTAWIELESIMLSEISKEGEGDNGGRKGKGHQRTSIRDPWTRPKCSRIEVWRWGWMGQMRVVGRK